MTPTSPSSGRSPNGWLKSCPDAGFETIEGAGHLPSLERPDELNRLLLEFLQ